MAASRVPGGGPPIEAVSSVFRVYDVRTDGDTLLYVGKPAVSAERLESELWPVFRDHGYDVSLEGRYEPGRGPTLAPGEYALVAEPRSVGIDEVPWTNVFLAILTVFTTLFVGSMWYEGSVAENPLHMLRAWPFSLAVLGVIGTHELGHYVMSRYHEVDASLPYFIPVPIPPFGTMGAVIKMNGRIPSRRALFDIGVAGPLAGLVATVVVTLIGLQLEPVAAPPSIRFNHPLLLHALADLTGRPLTYSDPGLIFNPVVFGGWLGAFITFLNLLPVGQLDGGHIVRGMLGERTETVGAAVPAGLFGLGAFQYYVQDERSVFVWFVWGMLALGLAYAGPATPIDDEPLERWRLGVGVLTFVLGLACFTPVPVEVVQP